MNLSTNSKMKNIKTKDDEWFFTILIFLIMSILFYQYHVRKEKRKKRIKQLQANLENGFLIDRQNLENDYKNILNDISKSYEKLKNSSHEAYKK